MTEKKNPQDRLPSMKQARTKTLWFITDYDLAESLEKLKNQDGLAELLGTEAAVAAEGLRQTRVREIEDALRKTSVKVVIRSMTRKAYDSLLSSHPPTEAQNEEYKNQRQKPSFDLDTYPMALVTASVIHPTAPEAEMEEWFNSDSWSGGEFAELFSACVQINSTSNVLNLGKG